MKNFSYYLAFVDFICEKLIKQKIFNICVFVECLLDVAQKFASDNAASLIVKNKKFISIQKIIKDFEPTLSTSMQYRHSLNSN